MLRPDLQLETEKLTRSWAHHEPAWLRDYLVSKVEDPRLNLQSIVSRHFIVRSLFGDRFGKLMNEEYAFAAICNWLLLEAKLADDEEGRTATLYALSKGADNAEGLYIPPFVSRAFASLPSECQGLTVPNYIHQFLSAAPGLGNQSLKDKILNTFAEMWSFALCEQQPSRVSVLEPACGSANEFRFFPEFGIDRLVDYTGFDLCPANVQNALALFPEARFNHANVFDIPAVEKSFELCVVHDLFEHLSMTGLEQAVKEICRVTRKGICIGFFQMDEIAEHVVRPVEEYHWNLLSMQRMKHLFGSQAFEAQVIHIGTFLSQCAPGSTTHNPNAYTFLLRAR